MGTKPVDADIKTEHADDGTTQDCKNTQQFLQLVATGRFLEGGLIGAPTGRRGAFQNNVPLLKFEYYPL
jgi:hypothetical protein